ncbi:S-adenosyl-L-methionine-dependent methyltransferase [Amylocystis lapponica]|nr:S-adenosyl-L-methionine-dependent methyltransferase [Amylocystis lapponica]
MAGKAQVDALLSLISTAAYAAVAEYDKKGYDVPSLDSTDASSLSAMAGNLSLKRAVRMLEGACEQLCVTLAMPSHTMVNRVQSYDWACMRVVRKARVADVLAEHPEGLHVDELARIVDVEKGKLARVLRLLGTRHCFREVDTDIFANNRLSLVLHSSNSAGDLTTLYTDEVAQGAFALRETLQDPDYGYSYEPTKSPFMYSAADEEIDGTFFNWMVAHPERRESFGRGMLAVDEFTNMSAILEQYPWMEITTVCDVGSGVGAFSIPLTQMYPHIKTTLQDLPETVGHAEQVWTASNPEPIREKRVSFVPLDFFAETPVRGQDVYYLRSIIHNWPDARAAIILRQVRQAMGPNSRLLIHDDVIQHLHRAADGHDSDLGVEVAPEPLLPNFGAGNRRMYNLDLTMLILYNSRERTLRDFVRLGNAGGLRLEKVWDLAESSVLEFRLAE